MKKTSSFSFYLFLKSFLGSNVPGSVGDSLTHLGLIPSSDGVKSFEAPPWCVEAHSDVLHNENNENT